MRYSLRLFCLLFIVTRLPAAETILLGAAGSIRESDYEFARLVADHNASNQSLRIAGQLYEKGVGTQLETTIFVEVNGATRFTAKAGVDDATATNDAVIFEVQADGQVLWRSGELHKGAAPVAVDIDLRGTKDLRLLTLAAGSALSQAHADWVDAKFEAEGTAPKAGSFHRAGRGALYPHAQARPGAAA